MGGPIEVDDGDVMSIGSPGIDSVALVNGCIVTLFLELCVGDPPMVSRASTCVILFMSRGVKQDVLPKI